MEETVMATKKIATPPSPQLVEGVLFEARTAWGTVTVLGIPFEYLDRLWAVHLAIGDTGLWPKWVVSDVATGANVPGVIEGSPDLARTSALKVLANSALRSSRRRPRSSLPARSLGPTERAVRPDRRR